MYVSVADMMRARAQITARIALRFKGGTKTMRMQLKVVPLNPGFLRDDGRGLNAEFSISSSKIHVGNHRLHASTAADQ